MYCMPQDKSRVYVKLGGGEEKEGRVSTCLRTNGETCEGAKTASQRIFHTEASKGLELYPESVTLTGGKSGAVSLADDTGLLLASGKGVLLYAKGSVSLQSEGIVDLGAAWGAVFATVFITQ